MRRDLKGSVGRRVSCDTAVVVAVPAAGFCGMRAVAAAAAMRGKLFVRCESRGRQREWSVMKRRRRDAVCAREVSVMATIGSH